MEKKQEKDVRKAIFDVLIDQRFDVGVKVTRLLSLVNALVKNHKNREDFDEINETASVHRRKIEERFAIAHGAAEGCCESVCCWPYRTCKSLTKYFFMFMFFVLVFAGTVYLIDYARRRL